MKKIIDYIQFNDEVDMLEFHLTTLFEVVDFFIIVESEYTFTGKPKALYFRENWNRFEKFSSKLVYVNHTEVPNKVQVNDGRQWQNEIAQRNLGLLAGLRELHGKEVNLSADDFIAITDCDEILDPNSLLMIKHNPSPEHDLLIMQMDMYYYDFRRQIKEKWRHVKLATFGKVESGFKAHDLRHMSGRIMERGGWHLSYFGGVNRILRKLDDFSHQEYNSEKFRSVDWLTSAITNGIDLFDRPAEFEPNDFTYMPPDWRQLRIDGNPPVPNLSARQQIYDTHDPYADFTEVKTDIQGWASDSPVFEAVIRDAKPRLILEVGVWKGASTITMSRLCQKYCTSFEIICIDTFLGSFENWLDRKTNYISSTLQNGRPNLYEIFLSNIISEQLQESVTPLPIDSVNAAHLLGNMGIRADLIYIDAGHSFESVLADLLLYKNLVRPGGYLLGDDWFHPPIKRAVREALGDVSTLSPDKYLWQRK